MIVKASEKYAALDSLIMAQIGYEPVRFHVIFAIKEVKDECICLAKQEPPKSDGIDMVAYRMLEIVRHTTQCQKAGLQLLTIGAAVSTGQIFVLNA